MQSYNHLSEKERQEIEFILNNGLSLRAIARRLNRSHSTILREVRRVKNYNWHDATMVANARRRRGSYKIEQDLGLRDCIIDRLRDKWTPEQIAGRMRLSCAESHVCQKTIYNFVNRDKKLRALLPNHKFIFKKNPNLRAKNCTNLPNISDRTDENHITSWEADLMRFGRKNKANITTLFNRRTKLVRLVRNEDARRVTVLGGVFKNRRGVKILTMDRGLEFIDPAGIKAHGILPFYCDAMSPWQKGGCENTIRRLRRWLPRYTDISSVSQSDIDKIAKAMNNTPRKILGWYTPAEAYRNHKWCS